METENEAPEIQETPLCNNHGFLGSISSISGLRFLMSYHLSAFQSLRSQFPKQRWPTKLARQVLRKHFLNLFDAGIPPRVTWCNPLEKSSPQHAFGMVTSYYSTYVCLIFMVKAVGQIYHRLT